MRKQRGVQPGFTLTEMLITITVMSIVAAMVVPAMLTQQSFVAQAATRSIAADVMFAQNEAIARQSPRRLTFDVADNRYSITDADGVPVSFDWRGGSGDDSIVDFDIDPRFRSVNIVSASFGGNNYLEFDDMGSPTTGGQIEIESIEARFRIKITSFSGRVTIEKVKQF